MTWIGVDFDGTLAHKATEEPIGPMVERVKKWLAEGQEVRIFTTRVSVLPRDANGPARASEQERAIGDWCERHIGARLPVTCYKDYEMLEMWDDNCHRVEKNTGRMLA